MKMNKAELSLLKENLPKGFRQTLADQCRCSVASVDSVLAGTRSNIDIIKAAVEMAKTFHEEKSALKQKINALEES